MKRHIHMVLPFLIAGALRLYPYFVSRLPFSTDAWSPIRNAELLIEHTPIRLDDGIFDGYNNYWPANSLFGAVVSQVTGLEPVQAMAIFLPLTGSIAILIFYVLVKRLYNAKISFIASIIFGTTFNHAFFTAGVTKETYANPLYFSLIFIFLHPAMSRPKRVVLFTIAAMTLAFAHHLASIITIAILSSMTVARFINNVSEGSAPNKSDFTLASILVVANALYYGLYAHAGFKFALTYADWLSAASYQILGFSLATYLISKPYIYAQAKLITGLVAASSAVAFLLPILAVRIPLADFPIMPEYCQLYVSPYFILVPFITLGCGYQRGIKRSMAPVFWLATLMGLEAYAISSNSTLSPGLWIRIPNFLYAPLGILSATGLYRLYETVKKASQQKLIKAAVMTVILAVAAINVYTLYAAVSLQERYMGYQWLYRIQEYEAGAWIAAASESLTVAGDLKAAHLMRDYFNAEVDIVQGFRYLTENRTSRPQIMFIYGQMMNNGYVLDCHGVDLIENWTERTFELNLVYSNGFACLYAG